MEPGDTVDPDTGRFPADLMHAAATLYYVREENQVAVARTLGVSRATVSRLLSEARRLGIVQISVVDPAIEPSEDLAQRAAEVLGLRRVFLAPQAHEAVRGASLAAAVGQALVWSELGPDDVLLVSSGRTVWDIGQSPLPSFPGTLVTPTVGGQDEPEAWYQTNEITRQIAQRIGGRPVFLYAPAQPGPGLYGRLREDPSTMRVFDLWSRASCALLGIGAPPIGRASMPGFVPREAPQIQTSAGDICTRFFDEQGAELEYPGSNRLIATTLDVLRAVPTTIAVAVGESKVPSIVAAARARWVNTLVTDVTTADAIVGRHRGDGWVGASS